MKAPPGFKVLILDNSAFNLNLFFLSLNHYTEGDASVVVPPGGKVLVVGSTGGVVRQRCRLNTSG